MAKQQSKTDEQKELERKAKLEKLKADIESGVLKDLSKVSKKDRKDLINMGVSFEEPKPQDDQSNDTPDEGDKSEGTDSEEDPEESKEKDAPKNAPEIKGDKVKVFSLVNMVCLDGTKLVAGEFGYPSQKEYERLKKDARGPFFKE